MTFTVSPELFLSLLGQAVLIGIAWGLIRGELKTLRRELDDVRAHQAGAAETATMVTRLEERLTALTDELKRQPQVIALCVGEAIKAALRYAQPTQAQARG